MLKIVSYDLKSIVKMNYKSEIYHILLIDPFGKKCRIDLSALFAGQTGQLLSCL